MLGFDHLHYVPVLKAKQGELNALARIPVEERERITPLFEAPPPKEKPEEAFDLMAERLAASWRHVDECFVDLLQYRSLSALGDGSHPVARFFAKARELDLIAVPVTGLDRDQAQRQAVKAVAAADRKGAAVRLRRAEAATPARLEVPLRDLCAELGLDIEQVDLLVDLGAITATSAAEMAEEARTLLRALPLAGGWRSLTLASGAFPQSSTAFAKPGEVGSQPRRDWLLWKDLVEAPEGLARLPAFGDYGADNPAWIDFDPETMHPTAGIRYTTPESWLMVRGRLLASKTGYGQFHGLSQRMLRRPEYRGAGHCWGDGRIRKCASGSGGPGGLQTWREVATSHHLRIVDGQIASLAASSAVL